MLHNKDGSMLLCHLVFPISHDIFKIAYLLQIARLVEAEQELLSNNLCRKLQKATAEKVDLEYQLTRSTSSRSSRSGSLSLTGTSILFY